MWNLPSAGFPLFGQKVDPDQARISTLLFLPLCSQREVCTLVTTTNDDTEGKMRW